MDFNELKNKLVQSTKQAFLKIYNEILPKTFTLLPCAITTRK